ncbi:MAG: SOS response-associated peptidase [Anaerolineae bacterium]
MCGRFTLTANAEAIQAAFNVQTINAELLPRYNIAPTQPVAVVLSNGERHLEMFRWGLIPFWAKDPAIGNRMINARAETVAEKPSFKTPLKHKRCLVVSDGFYEWRKEESGKTPMYIRLASGEPFAFAGLWDTWSKQDEPLNSCTIITTAPNEFMAPIHNRMPAILTPEAIDVWLDPSETNPERLLPLLRPYPPESMTAHAVSRLVNSPANDVPACIEPA